MLESYLKQMRIPFYPAYQILKRGPNWALVKKLGYKSVSLVNNVKFGIFYVQKYQLNEKPTFSKFPEFDGFNGPHPISFDGDKVF